MLNVLLTHGYFLHEDPREREIMRPYPPLGLLYIAAYLEKHGVETEVYDSTFFSFDQLANRLLEAKPKIIGMYTNLMTRKNILKIIRFIRSQDSLKESYIVLGGPEIRNHAINFLQNGADVLVIGEGEESMLEVVQNLSRKDVSTVAEKVRHLTGISFKDDNGEAVIRPDRSLIRQIDDLPEPARYKIDMNRYFTAWKGKHGESAISVSTMRGCPYTCKWCSRAVYGQSYRRRNPSLVADELENLQRRYSFDTIWFVDDVFTISHKWLKEFHDEVIRRGLRLKYECISRADRMNEEVVRLLKDSGCFRIWIGAESGSQRVIDAMDRRVDVQQVRSMIRLTRSYGIQAGTFIMVGYPSETEADILETVRHLKESMPDHFTITVAYPITGTELFNEVKNSFVQVPSWATSSDRELDFKRNYSRKYYDYAVRYIVNEVTQAKLLPSFPKKWPSLVSAGIKSNAARLGMFWERQFR